MTLTKRRVEREKPVLTNTSFAIPTIRRALEYHINRLSWCKCREAWTVSKQTEDNSNYMVSEENRQSQNRQKTTAIWFLRRMDSLKID